MTLFQAPLLTDGATQPAQQFRMMIRDLARGSQGITEATDLKVTASSPTPNGSVSIGDGSGIVRSQANTFGGSYSVCNVGAASVDIAPTGGTPRSDMVVLRVLDPEYEGDLDPATDPIMFFDVVSNVSSTATTVPAGYTAIPLARIDLPASTAVITAGMITDLRQMANPRRQRQQSTFSPTSASTVQGTSAVFTYWSTVPGWTVAIPAWATTAIIRVDAGQVTYTTGNIVAALRLTFGASLATQQVTLADDGGTPLRRATVICGDTVTIPDAYRDTSQLLRPQTAPGAANAGHITMDSSTTLIYDVEFVEAPR